MICADNLHVSKCYLMREDSDLARVEAQFAGSRLKHAIATIKDILRQFAHRAMHCTNAKNGLPFAHFVDFLSSLSHPATQQLCQTLPRFVYLARDDLN